MRLSGAALIAGGCALVTATASAQVWRFVPTIGLEETLTDNVNLAPSSSAKTDLVTQITPGLRVNERSARTSLSGVILAPILFYARTGAENDTILPQANVTGTVEAVEKFLYVEAAAQIQQQYFSPFGAQPSGVANATANRYQSDSYSVAPYIKGQGPGDITYLLRDQNIWTNLSSTPIAVNSSYTNALTANISRTPAPLGWTLEGERTSVKFTNQPALVTQLVRLRLPYKVDPEVLVSASGGYEDNRYTFSNFHGAIYGVGGEWRPSPRTTLKAEWEHRFFGASYHFSLDERTALTTWNLLASRNITSYPQQIATLPAGADIQAILNSLLLSRIPDPAQRQAAVDELIQAGGLPSSLSSPLSLYNQQIYLQQVESASAGLLGARNNVLFTVYRSRTEPITGAGTPLPIGLEALTNNTQNGANVVWAHTLAPSIDFNANLNVVRTVANEPFTGTTKQGSAVAAVVSRLSHYLSVHGGVRYQILHSDVTTSYHEAAIFAGLSYVLH